jgi:hypothetical protein
MISTSSKKLVALTAIILFFTGLIAGSHYYNHQGYSVTQDSGFSIPEYSSQSELATQLAAPFIFIVVLLKFSFERVLQFVLDTNNHPPGMDDTPDVSRESTVMAIAVAGMMIPTPFWDYVRWMASGIGVATTGALLLVVLFLIFAFLNN